MAFMEYFIVNVLAMVGFVVVLRLFMKFLWWVFSKNDRYADKKVRITVELLEDDERPSV